MLTRPAQIPHSPGCYQFYNANHQIIYVGKAKDLASRLNNYFASNLDSPKTRALMRDAVSLEWTLTPTELDALILENELIKTHQPRYNIRLKDDKTYPYLEFAKTEPFPVPRITRRPRPRSVRYGPFADVKALRQTVSELNSAFPLRSCTPHKFAHHEKIKRPCLLYDINLCPAPCVGLIDETAYAERIDQWTKFFSADSSDLESMLTQQMRDYAEREAFELAANRRDALEALSRAKARQVVVGSPRQNLDVLAVAQDHARAVVELLRVRRGTVISRAYRLVDNALDATELDLAILAIPELYLSPEDLSSNLAVSFSDQLELLEDYIAQRYEKHLSVRHPQRSRAKALVEMALTDAKSQLARDALRRESDFSVRSSALLELARALKMPGPLYRIECYDMSHLQGTNYVGSMVVFEDALPKKDQYRHFNIKTVPYNNDVAAMAEVLTRRLAYWDEPPSTSKFPRPDLIILDGGLPQLHSVEATIASLGRTGQVPLAALAKREELLYIPGSSEPISLEHSSEALYLIQRLRDEAHRFAITFHRQKRNRAMTLGALDAISGLGPVRSKALLDAFVTLDALAQSSPEEIASRARIPVALARKVLDHLAASSSDEISTIPDEALAPENSTDQD